MLKFALCYGFRNLQNVVRKIKIGKCDYHFLEIMACPSGINSFVFINYFVVTLLFMLYCSAFSFAFFSFESEVFCFVLFFFFPL